MRDRARNTPAPLHAECEEIFDTISTLLAPLFQPLVAAAPKSTDLMVHCHARGAEAQGVYGSDGPTVFQGSTCAPEPTQKATSDALCVRRQRLIEDGTLVAVDGITEFTRDTLLKTPTGMAMAEAAGRSVDTVEDNT